MKFGCSRFGVLRRSTGVYIHIAIRSRTTVLGLVRLCASISIPITSLSLSSPRTTSTMPTVPPPPSSAHSAPADPATCTPACPHPVPRPRPCRDEDPPRPPIHRALRRARRAGRASPPSPNPCCSSSPDPSPRCSSRDGGERELWARRGGVCGRTIRVWRWGLQGRWRGDGAGAWEIVGGGAGTGTGTGTTDAGTGTGTAAEESARGAFDAADQLDATRTSASAGGRTARAARRGTGNTIQRALRIYRDALRAAGVSVSHPARGSAAMGEARAKEMEKEKGEKGEKGKRRTAAHTALARPPEAGTARSCACCRGPRVLARRSSAVTHPAAVCGRRHGVRRGRGGGCGCGWRGRVRTVRVPRVRVPGMEETGRGGEVRARGRRTTRSCASFTSAPPASPSPSTASPSLHHVSLPPPPLLPPQASRAHAHSPSSRTSSGYVVHRAHAHGLTAALYALRVPRSSLLAPRGGDAHAHVRGVANMVMGEDMGDDADTVGWRVYGGW
ncbi:hypothetical protein B0H11DRAFT_587904 [Mycena galericulata]|nr:hypothetical protein B0H11DRAFT_587904 [Mycena galericulata]